MSENGNGVNRRDQGVLSIIRAAAANSKKQPETSTEEKAAETKTGQKKVEYTFEQKANLAKAGVPDTRNITPEEKAQIEDLIATRRNISDVQRQARDADIGTFSLGGLIQSPSYSAKEWNLANAMKAMAIKFGKNQWNLGKLTDKDFEILQSMMAKVNMPRPAFNEFFSRLGRVVSSNAADAEKKAIEGGVTRRQVRGGAGKDVDPEWFRMHAEGLNYPGPSKSREFWQRKDPPSITPLEQSVVRPNLGEPLPEDPREASAFTDLSDYLNMWNSERERRAQGAK